MSVNNTLTEYLIDQQPSLAVVLRQKIGSQNTHYVHGLRGIASQQGGAGWSDAVSDGLGSVRGWLNGSQTFVSDVNYNPYGVPDASVDDFGFTGEMTDANGLVYLRARYYDPNVGNFVSLDPFEGLDSRPMSMNGYSWVEGNVANWVDPSGYFSSEDEIRRGDVEYSCHCGWLDWSHIGEGDPAFNMLSNMEFASNFSGSDNPYSTPNPQRYWGFRKQGQIGASVPVFGYVTITLFDKIAIVPGREILSTNDRIALTVSILMSSDESFEQAQLSSLIGIIRPSLRESYFSEEDLPSNLIGMYIGLQRYLNPGVELQQLKPQIRSICGSFGIQGSIDVYRNTYDSGNSLISGWQSWYPRYLPLLTCNGVIDGSRTSQYGQCNSQARTFPTIFTDLSAMRVQPQFGGRWWWQNMESSQSGNNQLRTAIDRQASLRPNLYEASVYTLSYAEPPTSP